MRSRSRWRATNPRPPRRVASSVSRWRSRGLITASPSAASARACCSRLEASLASASPRTALSRARRSPKLVMIRVPPSLIEAHDSTSRPVPSTGCWVPGAGCRVLGAGCWVLGAGCWVLGAECWVPGAEYRVLSAGRWQSIDRRFVPSPGTPPHPLAPSPPRPLTPSSSIAPLSPSMLNYPLPAPVAQRIERGFPKPCVVGSSPAGGACVIAKIVRG